jgi:hypothetical protein
MKTIQTKAGELLLIKVSEGTYDFHFTVWDSIRCKLKTGEYFRVACFPEELYPEGIEVIGKFSELKDKDLKEFVDSSIHLSGDVMYRDYSFEEWEDCTTVQDSFISLCKSQGVEGNLNNYLIIKRL